MKKYLMLIIAIVMVMSALSVMAQNEKAYTITPRLVYNFISDNDVSDVIGDMYGISVGVDVTITKVITTIKIFLIFFSKS